MAQTDSDVNEIVQAAVSRRTGIRALQLLRVMVDEWQREERQKAKAAKWVSVGLLLAVVTLIAWGAFHIRTSTSTYRPVAEVPIVRSYIESAARQIEQAVSTRTFPVHQSGTVSLRVVVKANGQVGEVGVLKSSGNSSLDIAALGLVRAASPLPPLPPELRESIDVLELTTSLSVSEAGVVAVSR
ncbi:energy transducer TonB [Azospira restricta]|uniref:TonB family protein n=1 Tax=Azospira restricta TaxID=404405 RepID=A0A974SS21_9RHOO|nr:TonB family protein [Azospira restricta]